MNPDIKRRLSTDAALSRFRGVQVKAVRTYLVTVEVEDRDKEILDEIVPRAMVARFEGGAAKVSRVETYTGEVYAVTTWLSMDSPDWPSAVAHVEFLDGPPLWKLGPLNQTCRVGNINGGDSAEYDNTPDLMTKANAEGLSLDEWRDAHGN